MNTLHFSGNRIKAVNAPGCGTRSTRCLWTLHICQNAQRLVYIDTQKIALIIRRSL